MEKLRPPRFVGAIEGVERTSEQKTVEEIFSKIKDVSEKSLERLPHIIEGARKTFTHWDRPLIEEARSAVNSIKKAFDSNAYRILSSDPQFAHLRSDENRLKWTLLLLDAANLDENFDYFVNARSPDIFNGLLKKIEQELSGAYQSLTI